MEAQPLTKHDLAAIRKAESVTFHHNSKDGKYIMRLHLNAHSRQRDYWTPREQLLFPDTNDYDDRRRDITTPSGVTDYSEAKFDEYLAFHMVHSAQWNQQWRTIAHLLKVGDELRLRWTAHNNSESITQVGYCRDELDLYVDRSTKQGGAAAGLHGNSRIKRLVFTVDVYVGPDNTARMVRPVWTA